MVMENNLNADEHLKKELVTILKNLAPICNQPRWLNKEIQSIDNRELENSFSLMSDIATALARRWMKKQPELFQESSIEIHELREFSLWLQMQPAFFQKNLIEMFALTGFIHWLQKQLELFQESSLATHTLREFIQMCQANTEIIFDPNETIEETTIRILNEMNHFKNKPTRSTRY